MPNVRAKNLSVNNVDAQRHFAERDDGCGEMVECDEAAFEFFIAHEQLAEAIEPAMADFDNPTPRRLAGLAPLGVGFLTAIDDVRDVAMAVDDARDFCAAVAGIGAQVFAAPQRRALSLDDDGAEHLLDALAIIDVGCGHDDRQRDATPVHQQVALAAFFFPDPSGWGRQLLGPAAL